LRVAFTVLDLAARLLFALGIGCLLLAAYLAWQWHSFEGQAARTSGEVVSYQEQHDGGSSRYQPRVRFHTANGDIVTVGAIEATGKQRFAIGASVPVAYKLANPMEVRIATFVDIWLGACISAVIGLIGVGGGLLARRSVRRQLKKAAA
jgi:Protein of unknown function (DUF3592)